MKYIFLYLTLINITLFTQTATSSDLGAERDEVVNNLKIFEAYITTAQKTFQEDIQALKKLIKQVNKTAQLPRLPQIKTQIKKLSTIQDNINGIPFMLGEIKGILNNINYYLTSKAE